MTIGLLAAALPACGDTTVNDARVASCFADHPNREERCLPIVLQPCSHHVDSGLLRACFYRLRVRWQIEAPASEDRQADRRPASDPVCAVALEDLLGAGPERSHAVRNGCRLFAVVASRFGISEERAAAFASNVDSLEACLAGTSPSGNTASCAGTITTGSAREDTVRERAAWRDIIVRNGGKPPFPTDLEGLGTRATRLFLAAQDQ